MRAALIVVEGVRDLAVLRAVLERELGLEEAMLGGPWLDECELRLLRFLDSLRNKFFICRRPPHKRGRHRKYVFMRGYGSRVFVFEAGGREMVLKILAYLVKHAASKVHLLRHPPFLGAVLDTDLEDPSRILERLGNALRNFRNYARLAENHAVVRVETRDADLTLRIAFVEPSMEGVLGDLHPPDKAGDWGPWVVQRYDDVEKVLRARSGVYRLAEDLRTFLSGPRAPHHI